MGARRFLVCAAAWLCLCGGALAKGGGDFDYSIDGVFVKGVGDSLLVSVSWSFRNWEIAPRKAFVFQMALKGGGRSINLRPVSVYGRRAARSVAYLKASGRKDEVTVRDLSKPVSLTVSEYFPYSESLDTLRLYLTVSEWDRGGSLMQLSYGQKAGFVKPSEPAFAGFEGRVFEPPVEDGFTLYTLSVPVVFQGSSYQFDSSLSEGLPEFVLKMRRLVEFRQLTFRNSKLVVYAGYSGDGEDYGKISRNRAVNFYNYLSRQCAVARLRVAREGGGFDWQGLEQWLLGSRYQEDRRLVEIVRWQESDKDRLVALRREKPRAWEEMQKRCFPALGRAVFSTEYSPFGFASPSAVLPVYQSMPELLSAHDFWLLSTLYDHSSPEWLDVVLTGAQMHPECWQLSCNAVQGLVERGAVQQASVFLRNIHGVPEGRYVEAVWCYAAERYADCVDILEELHDAGGAFADAYAKAVPFIDWSTNFVEWKRVHI